MKVSASPLSYVVPKRKMAFSSIAIPAVSNFGSGCKNVEPCF